MSAGARIMTNLEGLFSLFRDVEAEMDELRSMRRVNQIWNEMEQRHRGAWTMFGRFFDRHIDGMMHGMSSPSWSSSLFPHPRLDRFGQRANRSPDTENNVLVEFPEEHREIKITIEEPSVVITEVEDPPEHNGQTPDISGYTSPSRGPSPTNPGEENTWTEYSEKAEYCYSNSVSRADLVSSESVVSEVNDKPAKVEKKTKKVDFSKMEVHFEPDSGKVNLVETNEKPPSNQIFRRKRRHRERIRSDSPKLNFVGWSEYESENVSPNHINYDDRLKNPSPNVTLNHLENNLNLSIFNLRNSLFKNSLNNYETSQNYIGYVKNNEEKVISPKDTLNIISNENKILESKDSDHSKIPRPGFMSSKLQNMIQNSEKNAINILRTRNIEIKKSDDSRMKEKSGNERKVLAYPRNNSPGTNLKKNNSIKRTNSRSKENSSHSSEVSLDRRKCTKANNYDINRTAKSKVNRADSLKKSRVVRQESVKSNSSRGSVNDETRSNAKRNSGTMGKRDSANGRINRAPSVGRINSLKRGGIYVDGNSKRSQGATVTVISFSNNSTGKNKNVYNSEKSDNNLNTAKHKVLRNDSLKSTCSRESLTSSNRIAQKKTSSARESRSGLYNYGSSHKVARVSDVLNKNRQKNNLLYANQKPTNIDNTNLHSSKSPSVICQRRNPHFTNQKIEVMSPKAVLSNNHSNESIKYANIIDKDLQRASPKKFHHETSSLFQPIKKEKSVHSSHSVTNVIKTPIAIRKQLEITVESPKRLKDSHPSYSNDLTKLTVGNLSKLNLTSLQRSREPLRSFEKISNGWVGRCNIANREGKSENKWATNRVSDIKVTRETPKAASPNARSTPKITEHQQRESMIRLTKGFPTRRIDSPLSSSKESIEARKRSRQFNYTPSSISSQSSIPTINKRRPNNLITKSTQIGSSLKSETPSEPIYETLNTRKKLPSTTVSRRIKQPNPCPCNI